MAVAERGGLFTTKPTKAIVAESEESGHQLRRVDGLLEVHRSNSSASRGSGVRPPRLPVLAVMVSP